MLLHILTIAAVSGLLNVTRLGTITNGYNHAPDTSFNCVVYRFRSTRQIFFIFIVSGEVSIIKEAFMAKREKAT